MAQYVNWIHAQDVARSERFGRKHRDDKPQAKAKSAFPGWRGNPEGRYPYPENKRTANRPLRICKRRDIINFMENIASGTDIDAYCTKCKLVLAHSVVVMVGAKPRRVRCNTCSGEHNYRAEKPVAKTAAKSEKAAKKPSTRKTRQSWEETMKEAASKPRKKYAMSGSFGEGDWIDHAKFGLGCVQTFVAPNKITVRFADSTKLLVCNQS